MQKEHNMESIIYVGMDVHKDSYSVCCYKAREDKFYYEKKILSESKRVIRYLESVKKEFGEDSLFICGYEAGPTGFGLYRDLSKAGYSCVVMAPTSLKHPAGYKIKNDKVDARYLAKTLFTKDYSSVHVTTEHEESIKEFCRMRLCLKADLKKAKPNAQASVLIKQIAKEWKESKDVDTKQYNKNAEKDRKRFQRQLKEFQKLGYYTKDKSETEEEEDTRSKKSKKSQKKRSSSKASTKKSKSQRSKSKAKSKKKSQNVASTKKSKK